MNEILTHIRELRTKEKRHLKEVSDISKEIKRLKKQHFGTDEERDFTFELLEAVLKDYLTQAKIKKVVKNFEVSFERLELILADYLTKEQIAEVIDKLKEV